MILEKNIRIYKISVYARIKNGYYTFCTPECTSLIDSYLEYRRRLGEAITDKSPLIREMFDSHNPFIINAPKRLTERMIQLALEQALRRANVNQRTPGLDKTKRRKIMRSHGFRKWTITQMIKAKVDYSVREFLVGHKVSTGLGFNYDRTSVEDRLQEWSKAINLLTINPNQRLQKKVHELESEQGKELESVKAQLAKVMAENREGATKAQEITMSLKQVNEEVKRQNERDNQLVERCLKLIHEQLEDKKKEQTNHHHHHQHQNGSS